MRCPRCAQALVERTFEGVRARQCPSCAGLWLERAAFQEAGARVDPDVAWLDLSLWKDVARFQATPTVHPCPGCSRALVRLRHGDDDHALDYCSSCHGAWVDRDAFRAIVETLRHEVSRLSAGQVLEASLREAGHLLTHPGSALSEWKDLAQLLRLLEVRVLAEHPTLRGIVLGVQRGNPFD
jgi:Zn-finger nucleic acid-binding protein